MAREDAEENISSNNEDDKPTWESDLTRPDRKIWVVTTAAMPWRTGTAVNPMLRALYLTRNRPPKSVTLVIPWVTKRKERIIVYGEERPFSDGREGVQEQEAAIRKYARERCGCIEEEQNLNILFYPAKYVKLFGSIFPRVDICSLVEKEDADVAVLEEPEHLNWVKVPGKDGGDTVGWLEKFTHVVGVVHTNYESYLKQYVPGPGIIAPKAIGAASQLVVRAYCHRVIKLSATLPSLAPGKEIVCNVHGVRQEFIQTPDTPILSSGDTPIYFIGKLLWAKGFDLMMHIQDAFHNKTQNFFPIDIYGTGPDQTAIQRAFQGRPKHKPTPFAKKEPPPPNPTTEQVLSKPSSIRAQTSDLLKNSSPDLSHTDSKSDPLSIVYDFSQSTKDTTVNASKAAYHIADNAIQSGLSLTFSSTPDPENKDKNHLKFDPPHSLSELTRKEPLPARFLGALDHILLKEKPYKCFFNPSLSEVLCTTTAEALAMGKFVIIPNHPSNQFFLQFPNCLAYDTFDQAVDLLRYVLENEPKPLTEEVARAFTWEAATERFIKASAISKKQQKEWEEAGMEKTDQRIAKHHHRMGKNGTMIRKLFGWKPKHYGIYYDVKEEEAPSVASSSSEEEEGFEVDHEFTVSPASQDKDDS